MFEAQPDDVRERSTAGADGKSKGPQNKRPSSGRQFIDGFACNNTLAGLEEFYNEFGPFDGLNLDDEDDDRWLDPVLVTALLRTAWNFRAQLIELGFTPPKEGSAKDWWDPDGFGRMIKNFQKSYGIPSVSRVLDNATRRKLARVWRDFSERRDYGLHPVTAVSTTVRNLTNNLKELTLNAASATRQQKERERIFLAGGNPDGSRRRGIGGTAQPDDLNLDFFMQVAKVYARSTGGPSSEGSAFFSSPKQSTPSSASKSPHTASTSPTESSSTNKVSRPGSPARLIRKKSSNGNNRPRFRNHQSRGSSLGGEGAVPPFQLGGAQLQPPPSASVDTAGISNTEFDSYQRKQSGKGRRTPPTMSNSTPTSPEEYMDIANVIPTGLPAGLVKVWKPPTRKESLVNGRV
jgi:hypothetical protein